MRTYPSAYPKPLIDGYGISVNMGVVRTEMETGRAKQRRRFRSMPQMFNFKFVVPISQLGPWQAYVNQYCYEWFELDATSYLTSSQLDDNCSPHIVRFTSNLEIAPFTGDSMSVTVTAEMAPVESFTTPPVAISQTWIVARTPSNPSTDWYVANTPSNPSTDWVIAGSARNPAAYV